jgi:hypothetical protein
LCSFPVVKLHGYTLFTHVILSSMISTMSTALYFTVGTYTQRSTHLLYDRSPQTLIIRNNQTNALHCYTLDGQAHFMSAHTHTNTCNTCLMSHSTQYKLVSIHKDKGLTCAVFQSSGDWRSLHSSLYPQLHRSPLSSTCYSCAAWSSELSRPLDTRTHIHMIAHDSTTLKHDACYFYPGNHYVPT